jgi:hypothetical protein
MIKLLRNFLLTLCFATLVAACGGGGGGDSGSSSGDTNTAGNSAPPPPPDVTMDQLAGTWFGTADDTHTVQTFQFTVSGSSITDFKLNGAALTGLVGTLTKAVEAPRTFRFTVKDGTNEITNGVWVVDPTGKYLTYVDKEFDFGVLQKGTPAALPTYAQKDVEHSWTGDRVTDKDFTSLASSSVSGSCVPTSPASTPASSECTFALGGGVSRKLSSVALDDPNGRYGATYADTPASTPAPSSPTARLYLSPDKNFAAGWSCPSISSPLSPFGCDLFALSGTATASTPPPPTCTSDIATAANSAPNAAAVKTLLTNTVWSAGSKCIDCHGGNGNLSFTTDDNWANELVGVNSSEQTTIKRVSPGDAANSYLIQKLEGASTITGGRMPLGASPLSTTQIDQIKAWINGIALCPK